MSKATRERWSQQQQALPVESKVVALRGPQFRAWVESMIAQARDAADPIGVWVNVGPEEAEVLLSFSRGNRTEKENRMDEYARAMAAGQWMQSDQGFSFDVNGRLLNGHHRLPAVVRSGATIRVELKFGLPERAIDVIDTGKARSVADVLRLSYEVHNATKLVSIVRAAMRLESGLHGAHTSYSASEVHAEMVRYSRGIEALREPFSTRFAASFWGTVLWAYYAAPEAVVAFAQDVARGTGLESGDPAWTMREFLRDAPTAGADASRSLATRTLYALRARIEGRSLARFSPRDPSGENGVVTWFQRRRVVS